VLSLSKHERDTENDFLRVHQFYRQKNIGDYIVDFYCPAGNLVIEVDGGQHYTEAGKARDNVREGYLEGLGLLVMLRFSDRYQWCP
jgi:very-short-patch-repair endonuclease